MKMQKILVIDTETADLTGAVYDVGFVVTDRNGEIYQTYNALVEEIFTDAERMMGAFFAKKLFTHYAPMLAAQEIDLVKWPLICKAIQNAICEHNITTIAAYNLGFDRRVMRSTQKELGYNGAICPAGLKQLDIWQFACETKLSQKAYKNLAKERGWVSSAGNIKTGAEFAYRFCSGDHGFIEDHTALSDALIEADILAACFACKKTIPYGIINAQPWRIVNEKTK